MTAKELEVMLCCSALFYTLALIAAVVGFGSDGGVAMAGKFLAIVFFVTFLTTAVTAFCRQIAHDRS